MSVVVIIHLDLFILHVLEGICAVLLNRKVKQIMKLWCLGRRVWKASEVVEE